MATEKQDLRLHTSDKLEVNRNQFWQAVWIWVQKPHVVNRRLFGLKTLQTYVIPERTAEDTITALSAISFNDLTSSDYTYLRSIFKVQHDEQVEKEIVKFSQKSYLVIRKLLSRKRNLRDSYEICVLDYSLDRVIHYEISEFKDHSLSATFVLRFINDQIQIQVLPHLNENVNCEWLQFHLLPKLAKWSKESAPDVVYANNNTSSLSLVNCDEYNELYVHLKEKYGKRIIENWPENTDPLKFVYEDIAIATYLCLIWRNEKVSFVDLGCGNGLLVHILCSEGFNGFGIDIRPRKIWSLYSSPNNLKVGTVTPEENSNFPQIDWIIGNHSDELTPWIPVFAFRSSYKCKFFLLPCCAYEFSGRKYQRKHSGVSVYNDYIDYVQTVCADLGFKTEVDKLRIPSTKRICILGYDRLYDADTYEKIKWETIQKVVNQNQKSTEMNFTPRPAMEKVRNCTQIDKNVTAKVVKVIADALVSKLSTLATGTDDCDIWSLNCSLSIKEAILLLEDGDLKQLKNECGGLQTLLKNHHSIFLVTKGQICFRKPQEKTVKISNWKKFPCWFFHNFPFLCPLEEGKCSFIH